MNGTYFDLLPRELIWYISTFVSGMPPPPEWKALILRSGSVRQRLLDGMMMSSCFWCGLEGLEWNDGCYGLCRPCYEKAIVFEHFNQEPILIGSALLAIHVGCGFWEMSGSEYLQQVLARLALAKPKPKPKSPKLEKK